MHSTKAPGNSILGGIAFVQGTLSAAAACAIVQAAAALEVQHATIILWEYGKDGDMDFFVTNNCPNIVNFAFYEFNKNGFEFTLLDT
ncbi:MAG: hypothetical protein ACLT33_07480 [Lachnospira pectinoschiza]